LQHFHLGAKRRRYAFAQIESIGRCVALVDEIEKALAGATQDAADGGVIRGFLMFAGVRRRPDYKR